MQISFIQRFDRREVWILLSSLALLWAILHPPQALVARHHAWKAKQTRNAAEQAALAGDWPLAFATAEQGLRWAPDSYWLHFLLIGAAAAQEKPVDRALLARVFLHPSASAEERAKLLSIALDRGDQVIFSRLYNALDEDARRAPKVIVQRMRLGLQLGRHQEVAALFEQLAEEARTPFARYLRIAAMVQAEQFLEAQEAISRYLATTDEQKADAWQTLRLLNEIPLDRLQKSALTGIVRWIDAAKYPTVADRLIADRIHISTLEVSERPAYLRRVIARHPEADSLLVGPWLADLGYPELALSMPELSPQTASKEITAYEARLHALVTAQRWPEAWQWLEESPKGGHAVLQWLARAQVAHQLGRGSDRRQSLARAIDSAAIISSENNFFVISEIAHQLGEHELAAQAAMQGVQVPSTVAPPAPFFLPVLRYLWQQDRLDEFRQLNRMLLHREPGDLQRNNDELYLSLLLDETPNLHDIVLIGRQLNAARPNDLSFATTLAWALLRLGETEEARKVLDRSQLDWSHAGPADLLVRELSHDATSEVNRKNTLSVQIDSNQLCSAERELLLKAWQSQ